MTEVAESSRKRNSDRGSVAVEMALMLPFLCLFLMGILELSVLINNRAVITNATREGARYGISAFGRPPTDAAIQQRVTGFLTNRLISFSSSTPVTTITREGSTPGSVLRVRVAYPYDFLVLPRLADSLNDSLTLRAETTMRLE